MKKLTSTGLRHDSGLLEVLDQTKLPHEEIWLKAENPDQMVQIIKDLSVRGAPLIGVSAALSLALYAEGGATEGEIKEAAETLRNSRPTAVNLMMALDRMLASTDLVATAEELFEEDVALCEAMAGHGAELINDGDGILTHCNTGGLATAGMGTAFAVIRKAHEQGKKIHVYVDETRPLLQGGRLTTWELAKAGVPYTLICDNMAASLMRDGKIQKCFVGSDRVAMNGDFANKIGTYSAAVLAKHHDVEFYPVAPYTTIDWECETGKDIPIEERNPDEVRGWIKNAIWAPKDSPVFNPAFDVTPVELVTSLVLDIGVYSRGELRSGVLKRIRKEKGL